MSKQHRRAFHQRFSVTEDRQHCCLQWNLFFAYQDPKYSMENWSMSEYHAEAQMTNYTTKTNNCGSDYHEDVLWYNANWRTKHSPVWISLCLLCANSAVVSGKTSRFFSEASMPLLISPVMMMTEMRTIKLGCVISWNILEQLLKSSVRRRSTVLDLFHSRHFHSIVFCLRWSLSSLVSRCSTRESSRANRWLEECAHLLSKPCGYCHVRKWFDIQLCQFILSHYFGYSRPNAWSRIEIIEFPGMDALHCRVRNPEL